MDKIKTNILTNMRELFVAFEPSKEVIHDAIKCYFTEQFTQPEQRRKFITEALQNGQFIAVKVFLGRTGRPDVETMQLEINYVSSYAMHKAKLLEEQLWNVSAMGDLVDVTDEVLRCFKFPESKILLNHKYPTTYRKNQARVDQN